MENIKKNDKFESFDDFEKLLNKYKKKYNLTYNRPNSKKLTAVFCPKSKCCWDYVRKYGFKKELEYFQVKFICPELYEEKLKNGDKKISRCSSEIYLTADSTGEHLVVTKINLNHNHPLDENDDESEPTDGGEPAMKDTKSKKLQSEIALDIKHFLSSINNEDEKIIKLKELDEFIKEWVEQKNVGENSDQEVDPEESIIENGKTIEAQTEAEPEEVVNANKDLIKNINTGPKPNITSTASTSTTILEYIDNDSSVGLNEDQDDTVQGNQAINDDKNIDEAETTKCNDNIDKESISIHESELEEHSENQNIETDHNYTKQIAKVAGKGKSKNIMKVKKDIKKSKRTQRYFFKMDLKQQINFLYDILKMKRRNRITKKINFDFTDQLENVPDTFRDEELLNLIELKLKDEFEDGSLLSLKNFFSKMKKKKLWICIHCSNHVKIKDRSVQCSRCLMYCHYYKCQSNYQQGIVWFCNNCRKIIKN